MCAHLMSDDDAEELRQRMDDKTYEQALIAQLKHYKTSNKGGGGDHKRAVLFDKEGGGTFNAGT